MKEKGKKGRWQGGGVIRQRVKKEKKKGQEIYMSTLSLPLQVIAAVQTIKTSSYLSEAQWEHNQHNITNNQIWRPATKKSTKDWAKGVTEGNLAVCSPIYRTAMESYKTALQNCKTILKMYVFFSLQSRSGHKSLTSTII